jgi:class 3 adenylate cyclase
MTPIIARHDEILRELVEGHGDRITKHTGDGITAVFQTVPLPCTRCATAPMGSSSSPASRRERS